MSRGRVPALTKVRCTNSNSDYLVFNEFSENYLNCKMCFIDCKNRTYGVNCLEKCGNCKNDEACNVETGACPNGCTAGYHGTLCKDGECIKQILTQSRKLACLVLFSILTHISL